ncbi:MAG: hypothetical protein KME23_18620 [Goleter apudmare HA4340-LM2]|jgi:hypothetical protein|nr:hypothetical protein [Goleter apudmare HA4340-LM2]
MKVEFFRTVPFLSLLLLWIAYALLGWYLAAHHIIWLAGAFITAIALAVARKSISWLESLFAFGSQGLIIILFLSVSMAIIATWWLLFSLFLIPVATTILADLEMRFAGFSKGDSFWTLTMVAVLGLGIGEFIDLVILPSIRY